MSLEVNTFTLAGNDIEVVDQYARDQIQEIITTEVTKQYVDNADAALQAQIDTKTSKTYVDDADAALQAQIDTKTSKTYVDYADAALQAQIDTKTSKTYVDNADSNLQAQINGKQATITGAASTVVSDNLATARALYSNANGKIAASTVTSTELGRLSGVSSNIQDQLNGKQATITGAASTVVSDNLATARALYSNANGKIAASTVTSTELARLSGVSSNIQEQLNGKQATITGAATTVISNNLTGSRALGTNGDGKIAVSSVTTTELDCLIGVTSAIQAQINGKQATITGAASTVVSTDLTASRVAVSNSSGKIGTSNTTTTELAYVHGVTSSIQTQLNSKFDSSNFTSSQYEQVTSDQLDLYCLNISTLKIIYVRDAFKTNVSSGWTYLSVNGTNITLPEKYRPITDMYLTNLLPRGNRITFRINTDGTLAFNISEAADTTVLTRFNMIYV